MFEVGHKVVSLFDRLSNRPGTVIDKCAPPFGMGWYTFRWIDGKVSKGQQEFYRRITEEEFIALCLINSK